MPTPRPQAAASEVRASGALAAGATAVHTAVNVVGWLGSLVTLAALLVLGATAGGLADGVPAGGPTVTITYER